MLTYITFCITAYLVLEILRASHGADATGYLLVSGLMPLPVYRIGQSVVAGVFPIDVCLLVYVMVHGRSALHYVRGHLALSAGIGALVGFSILSTCSGVFNFFFVDPDPLKFYAFTIVKFWEYAVLAIVLIASRPNAAQLRRLCTIVLTGILLYEILHVLHMSGVLQLSGEKYFGPRVEDRMDPFSDRTAWFLATPRVVVGGIASISAWFSLMVFEAYRGNIKAVAIGTAALSVFSVFATTSRSDIVGLAVAAIVFAFFAPPRRWMAYTCAAIAFAGLYIAFVMFVSAPQERAAVITRISELWNPKLRAEGDYADRSYDRKSLLRYLPEHPREFLIGVGPGNFHSYQTRMITKNYLGHNSYLHWTGELGIGGFVLLLAWCFSVCMFAKTRLRSERPISQLVARTCLALVVGRMVAAWGAESLFGTEVLGCYSLYFVGVVYLLVSIAWAPQCDGPAQPCASV